jgi:polysaccharide export outer membrane protein
LVPIDFSVVDHLSRQPQIEVPGWLEPANGLSDDVILPGDTLSITVFENIESGILASAGQPRAVNDLQVESSGMVSMPYLGRLRAAGITIEGLRAMIVRRLEDQSPDPQVVVNRQAGSSSSISVMNPAGQSGNLPFDSSTRTVLRAVAASGGFGAEAETTSITIVRNATRAELPVSRLLDGSLPDYELLPQDVLIVNDNVGQFVALGYLGGQGLVDMPRGGLSLIEALGMIGGLNEQSSNPSGVFVFRHEAPEIVQALGHDPVTAASGVAYGIDMRDPESLLVASRFPIEDGDVLYVTQAPFSRMTSILTAITTPAQSSASLAGAIN